MATRSRYTPRAHGPLSLCARVPRSRRGDRDRRRRPPPSTARVLVAPLTARRSRPSTERARCWPTSGTSARVAVHARLDDRSTSGREWRGDEGTTLVCADDEKFPRTGDWLGVDEPVNPGAVATRRRGKASSWSISNAPSARQFGRCTSFVWFPGAVSESWSPTTTGSSRAPESFSSFKSAAKAVRFRLPAGVGPFCPISPRLVSSKSAFSAHERRPPGAIIAGTT